MDLRGSQTYQNLQKAFEGELKASSKYQIYGLKAREDGFEQIGDIFNTTSRNEREHAEIWFKILNGGEVPPTLDNLKNASKGENYEWTIMYKTFAQVARKEGFNQIADLFEGVAKIEKSHDMNFRELINNIENGKVFCKDGEMLWICTNCGNIYKGKCAPEKCPVCSYSQGFYELLCRNF